MLLLSSVDFFIFFFKRNVLQEHCQSDNDLDPDQHSVLSALIWVQTVCTV